MADQKQPTQRAEADDVRSLLNSSPTGQHLLLGELVFPFVSTESSTDGAVTLEASGAQLRLKVYSQELGGYTTFIGQLTPASASSDLKDAMVSAGIVDDGGATDLDLDEGNLTAQTGTFSGDTTAVNVTSSGTATLATVNISGNTVMTLDLTVRNIWMTGSLLAFFNATPTTKQTITGVRTGTLAQLQAVVQNMLTAGVNYGLWTDSTT